MTCKDCIHFDACENMSAMRMHLPTIAYQIVDDCVAFKDKSKFIELPCKVGDTVYYVQNDKILETQVINMYMRFDLFDEVNNPWLTIEGKDFSVFWADIGTLVFLTREEAEKVLKEIVLKEREKG